MWEEASHLLANSRFNEAAAAKLTECRVDTDFAQFHHGVLLLFGKKRV